LSIYFCLSRMFRAVAILICLLNIVNYVFGSCMCGLGCLRTVKQSASIKVSAFHAFFVSSGTQRHGTFRLCSLKISHCYN
jgi:hypothetical protein